MKSKILYAKLEKDFIKKGMYDDWAQYMGEIDGFLTENYRKRSMGLVCDNAEEIGIVYTAVFANDRVMREVLKLGARDAMLFVHHPAAWDITKNPVFQQMSSELLREFRERRISIYNLHSPLDNFSKYSTSGTLAKALGLKKLKAFSPYRGGLAGVIGKTSCRTVQELERKFKQVVGHEIGLYAYGDNEIQNGIVSVIAGGGNDIEMLEQVASEGANTHITGVSLLNDYSRKAHEHAQKMKINILGGTHYSTEMLACIAIRDYFIKLGLKSKFIADKPLLQDM